MTYRHEAQGLERYANTDPAVHFNQPEPQPDQRWRGAWMWCLRHLDYESAELIHDLNAPPSDECFYGDHDLCHFGWCKCPCHSRIVLKSEGARLRPPAHVAIEQEEIEAA